MTITKMNKIEYAYHILLDGEIIETVFKDRWYLQFELKEELVELGYNPNITIQFSSMLNREQHVTRNLSERR